jgi:hypothetical protein
MTSGLVTSCLRKILLALLSIHAAPAMAEAPEQLYGSAPDRGQIEVEYNGQFANGEPDERPHSLELFAGISDRVAIGLEIEGESEGEGGTFRTEEYALGALIDLTPQDAPVSVIVLAQVGIGHDGSFPHLQGRLIVGHEGEKWLWNSNLILRREASNEPTTDLAYAATAQQRFGSGFRAGLEVSGQIDRLAGPRDEFDPAHYAGPTVGFEAGDEGGTGFEVSLTYLWRIDRGDASRRTVRANFEFRF